MSGGASRQLLQRTHSEAGQVQGSRLPSGDGSFQGRGAQARAQLAGPWNSCTACLSCVHPSSCSMPPMQWVFLGDNVQRALSPQIMPAAAPSHQSMLPCSALEKLQDTRALEYELDFEKNRADRDAKVTPELACC